MEEERGGINPVCVGRTTHKTAEQSGVDWACSNDDEIKTQALRDRIVFVVNERDALRAENEKFRGALKEIAAYGNNGICPYGCDTPYIAQAALGEEGK